ncbi:hypothetical protein MMC30_007383 [Trapelia coarctata]|nr:hypothetical protein [Trapelia coarctata]
MAPVRSHRRHEIGPLKKISDFTSHLQQVLASKEKPSTLATDLLDHIDQLAEVRLRADNSSRNLDEEGTKLWNLSSKLKKDEAASSKLICLVRVFSCLLLDCGHRSTAGSTPNAIRILKCALKTTKLCLDQGHTALAERIVEKAAYYDELLQQSDTTGHEDGATLQDDLSREYYVMRVALAWRQGRLDLAENWLAKFDDSTNTLNPVLTENLADLLLEIGSDCSSKVSYEAAAKWLERAYDALMSRDLDELSSDAGDLQTAIMHALARALMKIPGDEARTKAWNIANDLDSGASDRLAVLILKLDLFDTEAGADSQEYCNILFRIIRMIHVTETTFKTVLHYIHKLRSQSHNLAHTVLDEFLLKRLIGIEKPEWLDKILVTIVWNITTSANVAAETALLKQTLDSLSARSSHPTGPSATHAAQILLWKRIEASYIRDAYADAIVWCQLALHQSFDKSGELNLGKIQRKLLLCSLSTSDFSEARTIFSEMSASAQTAQETQYLMYKVGLRSGDTDLASESLENIYQKSTKDATLLYACVLEAQHTGQGAQAVAAMQLVLEKYNYGSPPGVNLPALLRCTARLLFADLEDPGTTADSAVEAVCKLFGGAAAQAKIRRRDPADHSFDLPELDWFSRNTYNLALKVCSEWSLPQTIRLVQSCLKFIDLYPTDMDAGTLADLSLRRMFCNFLAGSLLVMMAREEDIIEAQLQYYLSVRQHAKAFHAQYQSQIGSLRGGAKHDLSRKASALLSFDFEAAVRLKAWGDASQIVKDSKEFEDSKLYGILADVVLSSEAPTETMIIILQQIVNLSWRIDGIDMIRLARWVRCLFQLALTSKAEIAEFLLDQVCALARDDKMVYPAEELEWLATTAFNRAVDFYCASQDEDCKRWAEKALEVTRGARDEGQLHELLESKYMGLRWEN